MSPAPRKPSARLRANKIARSRVSTPVIGLLVWMLRLLFISPDGLKDESRFGKFYCNLSRIKSLAIIVLTVLCGPLASHPTAYNTDRGLQPNVKTQCDRNIASPPILDPGELKPVPSEDTQPKASLPRRNSRKVLDHADLDSGDKNPELSKNNQNVHSPKPSPDPARGTQFGSHTHLIIPSPKQPDQSGPKRQRPRPVDPSFDKLNKFLKRLRRHWKHYLKRLLRTILSKILANAAAGNNWRIINTTPSTINSTFVSPTSLSSPGEMWKEAIDAPPEDAGDTGINGFLNQILCWAPIGPLFRRAESELDLDLEQVFDLFFLSPQKSAIRLSSADRKRPHADSSNSHNLKSVTTPADPRFKILLDHPTEIALKSRGPIC